MLRTQLLTHYIMQVSSSKRTLGLVEAISAVGGFLGLFLGVSLLDVYKLLEKIAGLIFTFIGAKVNIY